MNLIDRLESIARDNITASDIEKIKEYIIRNPNSLNDTKIINHELYTPLLYAVTIKNKSQMKLVRLLLELGAEPNKMPLKLTYYCPILIFCYNKNIERMYDVIKLLIEYNASVNEQDSYSDTLLHKLSAFASEYNPSQIDNSREISLIKLVMNHGADIRIKNRNNDTVFRYNGSRRQFETIDVILDCYEANIRKKIAIDVVSFLCLNTSGVPNEISVDVLKNISKRPF